MLTSPARSSAFKAAVAAGRAAPSLCFSPSTPVSFLLNCKIKIFLQWPLLYFFKPHFPNSTEISIWLFFPPTLLLNFWEIFFFVLERSPIYFFFWNCLPVSEKWILLLSNCLVPPSTLFFSFPWCRGQPLQWQKQKALPPLLCFFFLFYYHPPPLSPEHHSVYKEKKEKGPLHSEWYGPLGPSFCLVQSWTFVSFLGHAANSLYPEFLLKFLLHFYWISVAKRVACCMESGAGSMVWRLVYTLPLHCISILLCHVLFINVISFFVLFFLRSMAYVRIWGWLLDAATYNTVLPSLSFQFKSL